MWQQLSLAEWLLAALGAWWAVRHLLPLPDEEGSPMARVHQLPNRDDTFDAGTYGSLRYDFKAYGGVQGRIPDPSDEMIEQFMRRLREIAAEFGADDDNTPDNVEELSAEELNELLAEDKNLRLAEAQQAMCEAVAELCQGSPDATQLLALPFRVRQAFMTWLQRKLLTGEASAAATEPVPARRVGG